MVDLSGKTLDDCVDNVNRVFASDIECGSFSGKKLSSDRRGRCASEPADISYSVNYDDLCGPWRFPRNPAHATNNLSLRPRLSVWELLTRENVNFMKNRLDDEAAIKRLIENRLNEEKQNIGENKNIFLELAWSIVKFARDNSFTEDCISAIVGIFHLTYVFFLSNPWRTARETYYFFYETILLHSVENPPKSIELFTPEECKKSLEFFTTIILRHLPLVRFVSIPNYRILVSNDTQEI